MTSNHQLQTIIDAAWDNRAQITNSNATGELRSSISEVIEGLNLGTIRVASKESVGVWTVHQWVKKAVLLSFKLQDNEVMSAGGFTQFFDKVPTKFEKYTHEDFVNGGFGSCAQIGKNVHLSGGVGIGGVLEPVQAGPVIIEDNCFIGARSEVVEGVVIEENSVLSMGVYIGQSTKIYDRETGEVHYGRVPAGSVVVPGSLPSADGKYSLYAAVIVKKVDAQTRSKTAIN